MFARPLWTLSFGLRAAATTTTTETETTTTTRIWWCYLNFPYFDTHTHKQNNTRLWTNSVCFKWPRLQVEREIIGRCNDARRADDVVVVVGGGGGCVIAVTVPVAAALDGAARLAQVSLR